MRRPERGHSTGSNTEAWSPSDREHQTDPNGRPQNIEGIRCLLFSQALTVSAVNYPVGCIEGQYSPGRYQLEMVSLPPDAYVVTATASNRNILSEGMDLDKDVQLDIELATPGSVIAGRVMDADSRIFLSAPREFVCSETGAL